MSAEVVEIIKAVAPSGAVGVVAGILAYRSPQLVKELFAGIGGLLLTLQKIRERKSAMKPANENSKEPQEIRSVG